MKPLLLLFSAALLFVMSSCSTRLSYFTQDLYSEYNWSDSELKKIQFYISNDIYLRREISGASSEIISGKIKVENGRRIEEVIIRKGTPGAFIFSPKTDRFAVSFDEGSDSRYLMFGPNPKFNDRYVLLASEWQRRGGKVTYDDKTWNVSSNDAFAALLVDLRKLQKVSVNSHTVRGRKVN